MRRRVVTEGFLRAYRSFLRKYSNLEPKVEDIIDRIANGDRSLRAHKLHGKLAKLYAASVTQSYRIVFALESDAVIFIDIGSHDEVY